MLGVASLRTIDAFEMLPRVFFTASTRFCTPSRCGRKALTAAWLTKVTEEAASARPKAPNIGRECTGCGGGIEALGSPLGAAAMRPPRDTGARFPPKKAGAHRPE